MEIRTASTSDLVKIAYCHKSAFPGSLSTALGTAYLVKMLDWYLTYEDAFLFYIVHENEVAGYCGGMVKRRNALAGSASSMAQHSFWAAAAAFAIRPWLLFHREVRIKYRFIFKNIWKRIRKILRLHRDSVNVQNTKGTETYSCTALVVIGVSSHHQKSGVGSFLLKEFERKTRSIGIKKMLLTVKSDNSKAIRVYEKNGWTKTEQSKTSTTMIKRLQ